MRCWETCSECTEFCVVPAGMRGLEQALSHGCCFNGQCTLKLQQGWHKQSSSKGSCLWEEIQALLVLIS